MNEQAKKIGRITMLVVLVGAIFFYGGFFYGKSVAKNIAGGASAQFARGNRVGGANGAGRGMRNGQFINGEILSKDNNSITVKMMDGSSKIVFFSASTTIARTIEGAATDLSVGERVMVGGTAGGDGAVVAQSIQIRPSTSTPAIK